MLVAFFLVFCIEKWNLKNANLSGEFNFENSFLNSLDITAEVSWSSIYGSKDWRVPVIQCAQQVVYLVCKSEDFQSKMLISIVSEP